MNLKFSNSNLLTVLVTPTVLSILWIFFNYDFISTRDFFWDDMHFFKNYGSSNLFSFFYSNWDPDLVETAAYRPLSTWLYHFTYLLFEENVLFYRMFSVFLLLIISVIFNQILTKFNFKKTTIILTNILFFSSYVYNYMANWITLIPVLFSTIILLLILNELINYYKYRNINTLKFIYPLFVLGLLIREDLYSISIVIVIAAIVDIIKFKNNFDKLYIKFSLIIILTTLLHLVLRKVFVADVVSAMPVETLFSLWRFKAYIVYLLSTLNPGGFSVYEKPGIYLFILSLISYLLVTIRYYKSIFHLNSTLLIIIVIGFICSISAFIIPRIWNFLPNLFFISVLLEMLNRNIISKSNVKNYLPLFLVFTILFSSGILRSSYFYKTFSPNSAYIIDYDLAHLRGFYGEETMPEIRREKFKLKYNYIEKIPKSKRYFDLLLEKSEKENSKIEIPIYKPLNH